MNDSANVFSQHVETDQNKSAIVDDHAFSGATRQLLSTNVSSVVSTLIEKAGRYSLSSTNDKPYCTSCSPGYLMSGLETYESSKCDSKEKPAIQNNKTSIPSLTMADISVIVPPNTPSAIISDNLDDFANQILEQIPLHIEDYIPSDFLPKEKVIQKSTVVKRQEIECLKSTNTNSSEQINQKLVQEKSVIKEENSSTKLSNQLNRYYENLSVEEIETTNHNKNNDQEWCFVNRSKKKKKCNKKFTKTERLNTTDAVTSSEFSLSSQTNKTIRSISYSGVNFKDEKKSKQGSKSFTNKNKLSINVPTTRVREQTKQKDLSKEKTSAKKRTISSLKTNSNPWKIIPKKTPSMNIGDNLFGNFKKSTVLAENSNDCSGKKDLDLPTAAVVQEKVHLTATSTHSNLTEHQKNSIKAKTNPEMEPKTPDGPHSSEPEEDLVAVVNPSAAAPIEISAAAELEVENNVNANKKQVESPADQISAKQPASEASPLPSHIVDHKDLISSLQTQIEYYFSEENLRKDDYLKSQQDENKWVKSALIRNFPRIIQKMLYFSNSLKEELFKAAVAASPLIEYDEENDKIRAMPEFNKQNGNKASNQRYCVILREVSETATKQLLEEFLAAVDCSNCQSVAKLSAEMWELEFSTIEESQNAHHILMSTNQKFLNKEIAAFAKVKSNHSSKAPHSSVAARIDHVAAPIPQFSRYPYLAPAISVTNQQPHPQLSLVSAPGGRLSGQQAQNNNVTSPHAVHNPAAIHPQQLIYLPPQTLYPPMYKVPPPAVPAPQQPAHLVTQTSTAPAVPQQQVVAQQPSSSVQATAPSTSSRPSTSNYNPRVQDSRRTMVQPPTTGHQRVSYVYDNSTVMAQQYMSPEIYYDPNNQVTALPPQFVQPQLIQSRPSEAPYPFLQATAYMPSTVPPPGPTSSHNPGVQSNQPQVGNQGQTAQIPSNQRYSNNRMNNSRQSSSNNHQVV